MSNHRPGSPMSAPLVVKGSWEPRIGRLDAASMMDDEEGPVLRFSMDASRVAGVKLCEDWLLLPLSPSGEPTPELVELVASRLEGYPDDEMGRGFFRASVREVLTALCAAAPTVRRWPSCATDSRNGSAPVPRRGLLRVSASRE